MSLKKFSTLIELLEYRAYEHPLNTTFIYGEKSFSYTQLWERIVVFSEYLKDQGVQAGDRVVLVFPNSDEFFYAFYGVQRIGAVAVPIIPTPRLERILHIAQLARARFVIIPSTIPEEIVESHQSQTEKQNIRLLRSKFEGEISKGTIFEPVQPDDIAFIQFTSGSTGTPKGVQLTHKNLLTNMRQMIAGMKITEKDIFVSWLPVYHDMGLILMTMVPFYLGTHVILLPTSLKDLNPWLDTIQAHRGTFTAAPDFAYRLLFRHIQNPADYDLSSLRVALNAAEPVRSETIDRFHQIFKLKNVMVAGYGLAEATVGVSMWPPKMKVKVDPKGFVSVGPPFPEIKIQIIKDGQRIPFGEVGEIAIDSPANTSGYFDQPTTTSELFWQEKYIRSGDLGYLDKENNLYIVGREKNVIKYLGRTVAPKEIEEAVGDIDAIRYSAAIGIDKGRIEGEQVFVFAEVREGESRTDSELQNLIIEIVNNVYNRMGFRPARVYLLKPRSIPQTHNGKIQYPRLKANYLNGRLFNDNQILYPHY